MNITTLRLINEAQRLGRHRTKREAVEAALAEYIVRRKRRRLLALFGKIDYDPAFDHKRERRAER